MLYATSSGHSFQKTNVAKPAEPYIQRPPYPSEVFSNKIYFEKSFQ